jgi:hypothetical protein
LRVKIRGNAFSVKKVLPWRRCCIWWFWETWIQRWISRGLGAQTGGAEFGRADGLKAHVHGVSLLVVQGQQNRRVCRVGVCKLPRGTYAMVQAIGVIFGDLHAAIMMFMLLVLQTDRIKWSYQ